MSQTIETGGRLSDFAQSIHYVTLDTSPSNLISDEFNLEIEITANHYILYNDRSIWIFQSDGEFLGRIKGRQEEKGSPLNYIVDVAFSSMDSSLFVLNGVSNTMVYKYCLDGKLIDSLDVLPLFSQIDIGDDGKINLFGVPIAQSMKRFIKINDPEFQNNKLFFLEFPYDGKAYTDYQKSIISSPVMPQRLTYIDRTTFNDKKGIWNNSNQRFAFVDSSKKWQLLTPEFCRDFEWVRSFQESGDWRFYSVRSKNSYKMVYGMNRESEYKLADFEVILIDQMSVVNGKSRLFGVKNDLDGGLPFWPIAVDQEGNLIAIVEPFDLIRWAKHKLPFNGGKPAPMTPEFLSFIETITLDQNPIIVVVELKK